MSGRADWNSVAMKRLLSFGNGRDHKAIEVDEPGFPVYGSGGPFAFASDFLFDGESVLFGRKGTVDKPLYVNEQFWTVDTMYYTKIEPTCHARFLYYAALTIPFDMYSTNTALPSITQEILGKHKLLRPPLPEQKQIAAFLDYETAKIDGLIEKQQQLIALLGEKRQAVISHAVTKGLNPDAPMRDSGIEWLGEVPEHWEEYPLKVLLSLKHGYPFDSSDFNTDGEFILMTPGNFVQRGGFRLKEPEKYFTGTNCPDEFFLEEGQMLVAMTEQGPGLLGCALFVPAEGTYLHNQRLGLVQGLREDTLGERFLFHLFNSARYRAEVSVTSTGAKVQHTSPKKMLSVKVWLPPISEQNEIANFLDDRIERLEMLEVKAEQAVELLQERRTALISAAVTGKIDVRGWKPPSSARMPETEMEVA